MDKYLLEILKKVNTIIIPGLGAITITDSDKGDIMFMPYLKHDDGELSKHIANKEEMEVNEATNLIAKYVREILNTLDKGESYDMYQFGSFAKDDSGDIEFRSWSSEKSEEAATPAKNETTEEAPQIIETKKEVSQSTDDTSDDTENIYIPPIKETGNNAVINENIETPQAHLSAKEPISTAETEKSKERELNILEKEERAATQAKLDRLREEQNKPNKKRRGAAFYTLIFIGIIVIAFSSYVVIDFEGASKLMPFLASTDEEAADHSALQEMKEIMGEKEAAKTEEAGDLTTDTLTLESIESEEVIEEPEIEEPIVEEPVTTPVEAPVSTNSKTGYHIIVGSFGNPENAERFAAKLRSEGASASLIQENGLHKVSLGSFNTRDEAKTALNAINIDVNAIIHRVK
jgi:cell division protein FtsN